MKCFYTHDVKTNKKVFIPMCYGTIHSFDIDDCCCENPLTEHHFAKERFNTVVQKKNETIENMQAEINHLNKIINTLKTNNEKFRRVTKNTN